MVGRRSDLKKISPPRPQPLCLTQFGADPLLCNDFGQNAVHLASKLGRVAVLSLLLSWGVEKLGFKSPEDIASITDLVWNHLVCGEMLTHHSLSHERLLLPLLLLLLLFSLHCSSPPSKEDRHGI